MNKKSFLLVVFVFSLFSIFANKMTPYQLYNKGAELEAEGDLYKAYDFYQQSLKLNPSYIEPLLGLTAILFKMQQFDQALEFVERSIDLDPNNQEILNLKARILIGLGHFDEAKEIFEKILHSNKNNLNARLGLADLQAIYGLYSSAITSYHSILKGYPQNSRALMAIVLIYEDMKNFEEADHYIKTTISAYPNNISIRLLAARHYYNNKKYLLAENQAKFALKIAKDKIEPAILLAKIYLSQGHLYQALDLLLEYEESENLDILYLLAYTYDELGNFSKAILYYKKLLALNPGDEITRIALEETVRVNSEFNSEHRVELANFHFDLAREFKNRSYFQKAYLAYRRGLSLSPHSSLGISGLADIYKINDYLSKYHKKIQELHEMDIENIRLKDILEVYETKVSDFVSTRWKIDQFLINRDEIKAAMFYIIDDANKLEHYNAGKNLLAYFNHVFTGYEGVRIVNKQCKVKDYSEAFKLAQESGAEYFFILNFEEIKNIFSTNINVYFTSSGILLDNLSVTSAGNNRVIDNFSILVRDFFSLMPVRGSILNLNFEKALINLGKVDGIKVGDKLSIIRREFLSLKGRGFGFDYPNEYLVGEIEVLAVDDLVAEGRVVKKLHYNYINQRDYVIFEKKVSPPLSSSKTQKYNLKFSNDILKIY